MRIRKLNKIELAIILSSIETVAQGISHRPESTGLKEIEAKYGLNPAKELEKVIGALKGNDLLLLDYEGDEPKEIKIETIPLTDYGQKDPFEMKPMKFPYRKEGETDEHAE